MSHKLLVDRSPVQETALRAGMSRANRLGIGSLDALRIIVAYYNALSTVEPALAQPAYDIEGAMARIEKAGYDYRASTAEWLGVIRSELVAAIKETT